MQPFVFEELVPFLNKKQRGSLGMLFLMGILNKNKGILFFFGGSLLVFLDFWGNFGICFWKILGILEIVLGFCWYFGIWFFETSGEFAGIFGMALFFLGDFWGVSVDLFGFLGV